jgi:hypothetical protein
MLPGRAQPASLSQPLEIGRLSEILPGHVVLACTAAKRLEVNQNSVTNFYPNRHAPRGAAPKTKQSGSPPFVNKILIRAIANRIFRTP